MVWKNGARKKKTMASFMMGLLLCLGLLAGCSSQEEATVEEDNGIAVETATIDRRDIVSETVLKGTLEGVEQVNLVPEVSGTIQQMNVQVGDRVQAGDVICIIDSSSLQSQLAQAQASYNTVQSAYQTAVTNRDRMEILYQEGAISLQELEQARNAVTQSGLESASAAVQIVQDQIGKCTVRATISGTIASCTGQVGNMASQSSPLVQIVNSANLKLNAEITESNVNKIQEGQRVSVQVESASTEPFAGYIKTIAPAANAQTMTFPVEIRMANEKNLLKPGMFGEAKVVTESRENVVAVPKAALSGEDGVFVVNDDNTVTLVTITKGLEDEEYVEVLSGLEPGDVVVTTGQHLVYEGAKIRVIDPTANTETEQTEMQEEIQNKTTE